MQKYKTGSMPNTDFEYEEFEGLLGSFHLSLLPLRNSVKPEDKRDYQKAMQVLNGFARRYGVRSPEDAVKSPRARESWGNAYVLSTWSTLDMISSFWKDFGIGAEPNTQDQKERFSLGRTILSIFDRYGIARVEYEKCHGKMIPTKLKDWDRIKSRQTLADILRK